jgi:hypothetical protein
VIEHLGDTGILDKAAIMDTILHNPDRHQYNYLTQKAPPYLHLIDNGLSFTHAQNRPFPPEYLATYGHILSQNGHPERGLLHPEAKSWLMALNPQDLREHMHQLGLPSTMSNESVRRLKEMQARVHRGGDVTKNGVMVAPFWR